MIFTVQAQILDFCVLAHLSKGDTYGYELNQALVDTLNLSESTLYPVLRRLSKDGFLDTYDEAFDGRNRRYYTITEKGKVLLEEYQGTWLEYKGRIDSLVGGVSWIEINLLRIY